MSWLRDFGGNFGESVDSRNSFKSIVLDAVWRIQSKLSSSRLCGSVW